MAPSCFNCGKVGHATRNCFEPKREAAMSRETMEEDSEKIFSRVVRTVIIEIRELDQMLMRLV